MTIPMLRLMALPIALIALALGLSACGDDDSAGAGGDNAAVATALEISYWEQGKDGTAGEPTRFTVDCVDPTAEGCPELLALGPEVWAPVPDDAACTKIYGGPQVMEVAGFVGGRAVEATFTRSGGCEIGRYDAAVPLLQRMSTPLGGTTTAPAIAFGPTELRLVWWPKGPDDPAAQTGRRELTVTCPETPIDADKDCQELLSLVGTDVFDAALPPGTVCTQQFGGPQTLEVEGTLAGRSVTTTFSRVDGCQIDRWDRAAPLLLRMGRS
jgi:hypothetical protein